MTRSSQQPCWTGFCILHYEQYQERATDLKIERVGKFKPEKVGNFSPEITLSKNFL